MRIRNRRSIFSSDMMETGTLPSRPGAVGALLDEYGRALRDLQALVTDVHDAELITVVDATTPDPNCRSIQTVLAHVVRSGYTYAILVNSLKGPLAPYRERIYRTTATDFIQDLDAMFAFTVAALGQFHDEELEVFEEAAKALSPWGQRYDAEQMMEHAIVHILRHRRQLARFLQQLRG